MINEIEMSKQSSLSKVIAIHAEMLQNNHYCYFELSYTRYTEWMVWICSNSRELDPNRNVLLRGQGSTQDEACEDALKNFDQEQDEKFHVGQYVVYVDSFMPDTVEVITDIGEEWIGFNNGSRGCRSEMIRLADPLEIQNQERMIEEDELPFT